MLSSRNRPRRGGNGGRSAVQAPWRPSVTPIHSKIPKLIDGVTGARKTFELDVAAGISNFLPIFQLQRSESIVPI